MEWLIDLAIVRKISESNVRQERCSPDLFGKKLSSKLSKKPRFATVKTYKSY